MSIEAMKQALEALELERPYLGPMPTKTSKAITSLRQAIKEHALREVQRLGQEIEQEPFVLKAHQWEFTKKGTKNLIQVGTLSLGGIEENTDGAEFSESDIDRLEDVIEAIQEKLVTGRDQVKVPLLAYVETLQVDAPPQRPRVVFPTMLRKMWSGGEVQAWLDENVNKEKNNG